MKTIFLCVIVVILTSLQIFSSDTQSNVETPIGRNVNAWEMDEDTDATRQYWDGYYSTYYPGATQITTYGNYSSTREFNCHGYAWHMMSTEGGMDLDDPRWIGKTLTTDEDIYMTDGSYKEVQSAVYPGKVSWSSGDHSAITTFQTSIYKSKWNKFPLMEHDWDDTPYGTSNLKFYKLCYREVTDINYYSSFSLEHCKLYMKNVTVSATVTTGSIVFEDWVKIEGPFEVESGAVFVIEPQ